MSKGRIIFLHGFTQSSSIFYAKTSALRKRLLKLKYDVIYLNAPLTLTPADFPSHESVSKFSSVAAAADEETNYRAWWLRSEGELEVDPAIETIKQYLEKGAVHEDEDTKGKQYLTSAEALDEVPIVGIIGFSQGAGLAGLIARNFDSIFADYKDKFDLRFVVSYSGFKLPHENVKEYYEFDKSNTGKKDEFKMLHVVGELDTVVEETRTLTLYEEFKGNSDLLKHPGGHFVPNSKLSIDQVVNWIENAMKEEEEVKDGNNEEEDVDKLLDMMDNFGVA